MKTKLITSTSTNSVYNVRIIFILPFTTNWMNGFSNLVCNIKNYHQITFFYHAPRESLVKIHSLFSQSAKQPSTQCMKTLKEYSPRHFSPSKSLWPFLSSLSFFVDRYFLSAFVFCFLSSRPFLYSLLGNYSLYTNAVAEPHIVRYFALSVQLSLSLSLSLSFAFSTAQPQNPLCII